MRYHPQALTSQGPSEGQMCTTWLNMDWSPRVSAPCRPILCIYWCMLTYRPVLLDVPTVSVPSSPRDGLQGTLSATSAHLGFHHSKLQPLRRRTPRSSLFRKPHTTHLMQLIKQKVVGWWVGRKIKHSKLTLFKIINCDFERLNNNKNNN